MMLPFPSSFDRIILTMRGLTRPPTHQVLLHYRCCTGKLYLLPSGAPTPPANLSLTPVGVGLTRSHFVPLFQADACICIHAAIQSTRVPYLEQRRENSAQSFHSQDAAATRCSSRLNIESKALAKSPSTCRQSLRGSQCHQLRLAQCSSAR